MTKATIGHCNSRNCKHFGYIKHGKCAGCAAKENLKDRPKRKPRVEIPSFIGSQTDPLTKLFHSYRPDPLLLAEEKSLKNIDHGL